MSSSDYTSLRRYRQMFRPHSNAQNESNLILCNEPYVTQCNNPTNKINYYYVTPNEKTQHQIQQECHQKSNVVVPVNSFGGISISMCKYFITPVPNGSVIFTIDSNLIYKKGFNVVCSNNEDTKNYFEGVIYDYNKFTGEITIYQLRNINGDFREPAYYTITIMTGNQEFNKVRDRLNDLYEFMFNIDYTKPEYSDYNILLQQYSKPIMNLYKYFFDINLVEDDDDFIISYDYLNAKVNFLFYEFFDIYDLDKFEHKKKTYESYSDAKHYSLKKKISQLYLYFFNLDLSQEC